MTFILLSLVLFSGSGLIPIECNPESVFRTIFETGEPEMMQYEDGNILSFGNMGSRCVPGEPLRPVKTLYIPVPPGSAPELSYTVLEYGNIELPAEEKRTPIISGTGLQTSEVSVPMQSPPDVPVEFVGVIPLAGSQVAIIRIYPAFGEHPDVYASRIDISLQWEPVSGGRSLESNDLLQQVAPSGTLWWQGMAGNRNDESIFWGKPWARIAIGETGGYEILGAELENAGCSVVGSACSGFRLFTGPGIMFSRNNPAEEHTLEEVAFTVIDENSDGIFDSSDRIRFIGRGLERWSISEGVISRIQHRYATHNVYWLTWGGEPGLRIAETSASPGRYPDWGNSFIMDDWLADDVIWEPAYERNTGWVWMIKNPGGDFDVSFTLPGVTGDGILTIDLTALDYGFHSVRIMLNGTEIGEDSWSGSGERVISIEDVPFSTSNNLEIQYLESGSGGQVALVSVHPEYPANTGSVTSRRIFPGRSATGKYNMEISGVTSNCGVYDLQDFCVPVLLDETVYSGGEMSFSYSVDSSSVMMVIDDGDWISPDSVSSSSPGRLLGTVTEGDRLFVVPDVLFESVQAMINISQVSGFTPITALTSEIYNEFGQGIVDPGAIRSAVRWGMDSWGRGISGVVLVGDGHYDIRNLTTSEKVMIPPWIILGSSRTDCIDDIYAMVHEGATLPEVPISRIPVMTSVELNTCNAKVQHRVSGEADGEWMNRIVLVADDEWGQGGSQNECEHTENCELLAEHDLPRYLNRTKFYMIEYPWPPGSWPPSGPHPDKPDAREAFLETFNAGCGSMIYLGHGAANQIAHEKLMLLEDVGGLSNDDRLSFSVWATCDMGHFDNPGSDCIGEALVLHPAGGSISTVAATRGTFGHSNYELTSEILDMLYSDPECLTGDALWLSKLELAGSYQLNNRFYIYFGYPDIPLARASNTATVAVVGDTLSSYELNTISGKDFQEDGLVFVELYESSQEIRYTCLGGASIYWLQYGGAAYRGSQAIVDSEFELDCFIPGQARTGDSARVSGCAISSIETVCGASDPVVLTQGSYSGGDTEGPSIDIWIRGYKGIEIPSVTGDIILEADLTDSSGICILGGSAGSQITLFVDETGTDVSRWFTYAMGSSSHGRLTYDLKEPAPGEHNLILWCVDGIGNTSRDTLTIDIPLSGNLLLTETVVYPNPGDGRRCFSFRISEAAQVNLSIFTINGTKIMEIPMQCSQGYNQILWDGLDFDGDFPASGAYIYRLEGLATDASVHNRTSAIVGIVAVIRE